MVGVVLTGLREQADGSPIRESEQGTRAYSEVRLCRRAQQRRFLRAEI